MPQEFQSERPWRSAVIAGCGYVGSELARALSAGGAPVRGLVLGQDSAQQLSATLGVRVSAVDLGQRTSVAEFARECSGSLPRPVAVVHCASSNRGGIEAYRRVFIDGVGNLLDHFEPERFVFTSSTSVYAQTDGSVVDESSPAAPVHGNASLLIEAERLALSRGGIVARLAGLYGPGRCIHLARLRQGAVPEHGLKRIVNQLHRDDAVAALLVLLDLGAPGEIYNVVDDSPRPLQEIYEVLSHSTGLPVRFTSKERAPGKRGLTSKRVDNSKLKALAWRPRYASIEEALPLTETACQP